MSFNLSKKAATALAVAAACAGVSTVAKAENLCTQPPTHWDKTACELARNGSTRELTHFINRLKTIYNMDVNDYAVAKDVDRREVASVDAVKPAPVETASASAVLLAKK